MTAKAYHVGGDLDHLHSRLRQGGHARQACVGWREELRLHSLYAGPCRHARPGAPAHSAAARVLHRELFAVGGRDLEIRAGVIGN